MLGNDATQPLRLLPCALKKSNAQRRPLQTQVSSLHVFVATVRVVTSKNAESPECQNSSKLAR